MKLSSIVGALLLTPLVVGLAACSAGPTPAAPPASSNELVLAVGGIDSGNFDPKLGWGTHAQTRLTHSTLLAYNADLSIRGDLALSHEISTDGLTWTFKLDPSVKFSDGVPVTADDVVFTYNMLKDDGVAFDLTNVAKVAATDKSTVAITLLKPRPTFVGPLTQIGIVPKATYGPDYSKNPIGSGPYKVVQYAKGEQVIMESNTHYKKKPQFTKLTFLLLKEDAALAAARAGKVDVAYVPSSLAGEPVKGMDAKAYESIDVRGLSLPTLPAGNKGKVRGLNVEVGNDVTSDVAIRQAISFGVSRDKLIKTAIGGYGKPAFSNSDGMPWFNTDTVFPDGNIEKAKKLLADAGWADTNGDGIVEKNGRKASFKLYYSASDQLRSDLSLATAQQAKAFGIEIEPVGATWDEIYKVGKANAVMWGGGRHDPSQVYANYSSTVWDTGYNNMPQYKNPVVDKYLEAANENPDPAAANALWKKAQWDGTTGFSSMADAPIVWLARIDHVYLVKQGLDLGAQPIHSHGHEWQLFGNTTEWRRP